MSLYNHTGEEIEYYREMAQKFYQQSMSSVVSSNHAFSAIRWAFYNSNQWIYKEDTDTFLNDEDNDTRNRVAFTMNIIKPLVKFLEGNTIRTDFSYSAINLSPKAHARRLAAIREKLEITAVGQQFPGLQENLQKAFGVGKNREETLANFDRFYVDEYKDAINTLLENVSELNNFEELKNKVALSIAIDGVGIIKDEEYNGEQRFRRIYLWQYLFDTTCIEPDHSDAAFQGDWENMTKPGVLEQYGHKLAETERLALGNSKFEFNGTSAAYTFEGTSVRMTAKDGHAPVMRFYWRDNVCVKSGCVLDEFGQEIFVELSDEKGEGLYTEDDLIIPSEPKHIEILDGNMYIKTYPEVICYCDFIAKEALTMTDITSNNLMKDPSKIIILDYGILANSNDGISRKQNMSPYSVYTTSYIGGICYSMVDDIIPPQRLVNRFLSMGEAAMNNWRPSGTIIDEDGLSGGKDDLLEIQQNVNKGKVISIRANGQMNNVIGTYGGNMSDSTNVMFNMANMLKSMVSANEGVSDAVAGTTGGYRVSGTAVLSNISQGTLHQEGFFYAINRIFQQCYNKIATRGKSIYIENKTALIKRTGDNFAEVLYLTRDFLAEDIHIYIKRSVSKEQQIADGNQFLFILRSNQLIDDEFFADHINVSTVDQVSTALVKFQKDMQAARAKAAEQQQQMMQLMGEAAEDEQSAAQADQDAARQMAVGLEQEKNDVNTMKAMTPILKQ